ncbi:hypothetical protein BLA28_15440 [Eisenbergiella tayi]|uniref:Polysaccharide polymerase n=1 Tax=Eisenbergiella tayi TaxID=1432052 RepID=A0A1E3ALQ4_9FIRM|nr:hypothetical protein [Eisenbergiella tayi]ODM09564.1 hypothetical protein BEH84_03931 [Eisenbergiella tayi]OIZ63323.1 hypothetical protein BLA28_15440 [Eisenbergiella tayi]
MQSGLRNSNLFLFFVYLNVICKGIGLDNDSLFYQILIVFGVLALILKVTVEKYKPEELIWAMVLSLLGIISLFITRKPTLLLTCICIIGMKNVNMEKLFMGMYKIRLITFITVISLSFLGIVENKSIEMWRNGGFDIRYSLGYGHPNSLHLSLFILISLYIYVKYSSLKIYNLIFWMIVNLFIFNYSGSRTGALSVFLLISLCFLTKIELARSIILKLPKYLYMILIILSFTSALLYGKSEEISILNILLNGRVSYSNYYITNYRFTLFGNNILNDFTLFDNGYIYLYIQYGILGFLLISWLIISSCNYVNKIYDIRKAVILISYIIYIFTESFSPNIFMNIILFFAAPVIFPPVSKERYSIEQDKKELYI